MQLRLGSDFVARRFKSAITRADAQAQMMDRKSCNELLVYTIDASFWIAFVSRKHDPPRIRHCRVLSAVDEPSIRVDTIPGEFASMHDVFAAQQCFTDLEERSLGLWMPTRYALLRDQPLLSAHLMPPTTSLSEAQRVFNAHRSLRFVLLEHPHETKQMFIVTSNPAQVLIFVDSRAFSALNCSPCRQM
jgi:hypothetical protein